MISYIKGKVAHIDQDYIIIDNNDIGYYISINHHNLLNIDDSITIYTYQHFSENAVSLYGFLTLKEKEIFLKLISVKGVGVKTALSILKDVEIDELIYHITNGDVEYVSSLPKIGNKTASLIIIELKNKLNKTNISNIQSEAVKTLKKLGYTISEINIAISKIENKDGLSINNYIHQCIKILGNNNEN